jgi:hypothetical protein
MSVGAAVSVSLRAFARARGVTLSSVQRAIAAGRLTKQSVGQDAKGRPVITDPELATQEWEAHTRPRVDSRKGNGLGEPTRLATATLRERNARAEIFELDAAKRKGVLVPRAEFELAWSAHVVAARTKLLGIPSRAKQLLPHLTVSDLAVLDRLIREALEELGGETK